jgi:transcriptional regulator with XRE-family HTH domain
VGSAARWLHILRTAHGLTLQQLAAELGYATHAYISELESGKKVPTAALVLKVARRFNVSTDVLLKDEQELPSSSTAPRKLISDLRAS